MRTQRRTCVIAGLSLSVACLTAAHGAAAADGQEANLLANAGFEEGADGRPSGWSSVDFRTGGERLQGDDGGRSGRRYVVLRCASTRERGAWRRKVQWDPAANAVALGGWYRTRSVAPDPGRGASIRILFHRSLEKWDEIGLKQAFYPPADDWRQASGLFVVPAGTRAVVMELFNFFGKGEVHWDDAWLRPATDKEMLAMRQTFAPGTEIDREPVLGRNKPYSPGDGESVSLNPPPFLWLPSGPGVRYRLQVAQEPSFGGGGVVESDAGEWCCEMLTKPLAPGAWHWRYGVERRGLGVAWSRPRRFVVPADASPWAYPGRDSFSVNPERPHLFVRPGGLGPLREKARNGDLKRMADSLVRAVRKRAGEELVPEPDWLPKDRAKRGPAYTLTFRATRPPMDWMERAGLAYLLTGDEVCGREAKRRVLHFFSWDPKGSTNVFHNDEPAMWVMMRGVRAYDWTYDLYSADERQRVEASMRVRAAEFYRKMRGMPFENRPYESHAGRIIGFLGEAAVEFLPEWPEAREWLDYITKIYWGVYPAWGKDDGGWNEGPGYWSAYMQFGLHFVVALREGTGVDLSRRPFFSATPYYKLYVSPPHSSMSPFGDGTQFRPSRPAFLMYWFSTLAGDPVIRWYPDSLNQGAGSSILGVVLKDDSLHGLPPHHLPQARLFDGVGLACLHTDLADGRDDVAFVMRSSPYGAVSHGHNDQNCFVLEAFGEPLAIASGYYNRYGSPHHDGWTRRTKAKCGITFDGGKGQRRGWQAQGRIVSFVHGEALDLVVGDAVKAYGGELSRAVREVVHVRPGTFVVRDDLASAEQRRYEFQLHALDKMTVDEDGGVVIIKRPNAWLVTTFLEPAGATISQTDEFDPPPTWPPDRTYANNWHATVASPQPARHGQFLSVLSAVRPDDTAPVARRVQGEGAMAVELRGMGEARTVVGFASPGAVGLKAVAGVRTDASVFAVCLEAGGRVTAWLARDARELAVNGVELLRASESMTVTAAIGSDGGRIDTEGVGGSLVVWWPCEPVAVTRVGRQVAVKAAAEGVSLSVEPGRDRLLVWHSEPVAPGPVTVSLAFGQTEQEVSGRRYGRGRVAAGGKTTAPRGEYSVDLPHGVDLRAGVPSPSGTLWLRGEELVSVRGRDVPPRLELSLRRPAARLPAEDQSRVPEGLVFEAESSWSESGGEIRVSGGGHAHVSGDDNLWGWNTTGHTLFWDVDVPRTDRYQVWLVGATQGGLLAELRVENQEPLALWFEPTGGWGRKEAGQWRAFRVRDGAGEPVGFELTAGRRRLALTNWSGMGLNLDRIVLAPQGGE